jgi:hypothetical protein
MIAQTLLDYILLDFKAPWGCNCSVRGLCSSIFRCRGSGGTFLLNFWQAESSIAYLWVFKTRQFLGIWKKSIATEQSDELTQRGFSQDIRHS